MELFFISMITAYTLLMIFNNQQTKACRISLETLQCYSKINYYKSQGILSRKSELRYKYLKGILTAEEKEEHSMYMTKN
jgi:hypothetical protein